MSRKSNQKHSAMIEFEGEIDYVQAPTVVCQGVGKTYSVTSSRNETGARKIFKQKRQVRALQNINFVARKGESIGLLGRNGSGKSTLLRLISGGESVSEGALSVSSKPTLLGVTPALQPYLTGEQNILLGCLALGMNRDEAEGAIDAIADWSDIGNAIYRPMNTYSSGMSARLSFAISTSIKPEILLVDEALSTGDAAFAKKAQARMKELLQGAGNLFLVSHAPAVIEENCERALWLHLGHLIADGPTEVIAKQYSKWTALQGEGKDTEAWHLLEDVKNSYNPPWIEFE